MHINHDAMGQIQPHIPFFLGFYGTLNYPRMVNYIKVQFLRINFIDYLNSYILILKFIIIIPDFYYLFLSTVFGCFLICSSTALRYFFKLFIPDLSDLSNFSDTST